MKPRTKEFYEFLKSKADENNQVVIQGLPLAKEYGKSRQTIELCQKELIELGYIKKEIFCVNRVKNRRITLLKEVK